MKVVIAGCGIVGAALAERLSEDNHNIKLIDIDEENLNFAQNSLDVMCITGSATAPDSLSEAEIKSADLFIAVTDSDEENLLACLLSKKMGCKNTIARVRNLQSYKAATLLKEEMGLSMVINPEMDAARDIFNSLKYKPVGQVEQLAKGTMEIMTCVVKKESSICGVALKDISTVTKAKVLVCGVKKSGNVFIPDANTVIDAGDTVSFIATVNNAITFFEDLKYNMDPLKNITIIGGSKLGVYLAMKILDTGVPVKLIDNSMDKCKTLLNLLPDAEIVCGDGTDKDVLDEEGVLKSSVVVAATEEDAVNVMEALYLSKEAPDTKIFIKTKKSDFDDLLYNLNIGSVYNPKYIAVEHIARYVRAMQNSFENEVEASYRVIDNKVEVLEFKVNSGLPHLGKNLSSIKFKKNLRIATIYRHGNSFIPGGGDTMEPGDIVIVVTMNEDINRFADIFA